MNKVTGQAKGTKTGTTHEKKKIISKKKKTEEMISKIVSARGIEEKSDIVVHVKGRKKRIMSAEKTPKKVLDYKVKKVMPRGHFENSGPSTDVDSPDVVPGPSKDVAAPDKAPEVFTDNGTNK